MTEERKDTINEVKDKVVGFVKENAKEIGLVLIGAGTGILVKDKVSKWYAKGTQARIRTTSVDNRDEYVIYINPINRFNKQLKGMGLCLSLDDTMELAKDMYDECVQAKHALWEAANGNVNHAANP